jgi:hypothetical protein
MQQEEPKVSMTTVAGRPTKVRAHLTTLQGSYVQCRLATGEDVHVPLVALYELFKRELVEEVKLK